MVANGARLRVDHQGLRLRFQREQADWHVRGDDSVRGVQCWQATAGAHQQARQFFVALLVEAATAARNHPDWRRRYIHLAMRRHKETLPGQRWDAGSVLIVLDVAEWIAVFTEVGVRFVRGTARYRTWREVERRGLGRSAP